jgi:hypothetical protein
LIFPETIDIRFYNNKLEYTSHTVTKYSTDKPNKFVYSVAKTNEIVAITVNKHNIIAKHVGNDITVYTYDFSTPIKNVVCDALTQRNRLAVLHSYDVQQEALF